MTVVYEHYYGRSGRLWVVNLDEPDNPLGTMWIANVTEISLRAGKGDVDVEGTMYLEQLSNSFETMAGNYITGLTHRRYDYALTFVEEDSEKDYFIDKVRFFSTPFHSRMTLDFVGEIIQVGEQQAV